MRVRSLAAIADGSGGFRLEETLLAQPREDEVLIRIKAAGICHTDYDSLKWGKPIVMGHEGSGVIEAIGSTVQDLHPGDRVALNWATPCMQCFQCQQGNQHLCEVNSPVIAGGNGFTPGHAHLDGTHWRSNPIERSFNLGTLSEFALVKSSAVVRINSPRLEFPAAAIIGCGVMTGYGSVVRASKLPPGSNAVILGCGGVGLNVIQGCRLRNASKIIAVDTNKNRLSLAKQFGATHTLLADPQDKGLMQAATEVRLLTNGRGADFAFEATARPELGAAPLAMIRNGGMAVQVSGIEQEITIDMNLFEWDKTYLNPLYGQCQPQEDFPEIIRLHQNGLLLLDELITETYSLHQLQRAFDDMLSGKNAKGVIVFE